MPNYLNIYSSEYSHDTAYIVGNLEGLLALKKAIDQALDINSGKIEATATDDEDFVLRVRFIDDETKLVDLLPPYAEPTFKNAAGTHPANMGLEIIK